MWSVNFLPEGHFFCFWGHITWKYSLIASFQNLIGFFLFFLCSIRNERIFSCCTCCTLWSFVILLIITKCSQWSCFNCVTSRKQHVSFRNDNMRLNVMSFIIRIKVKYNYRIYFTWDLTLRLLPFSVLYRVIQKEMWKKKEFTWKCF
jgi:hypothetical protein